MPTDTNSDTTDTILPKHYEPQIAEQAGSGWEASGYFSSQPQNDGRESFSILLPPPNVTGMLHMGHAFQHTLMDTLIRYQRMCGKNTLWQPGTDHAGIAMQIVATRELERRGIDVAALSREEFLTHAWEWKQQSGNTITQQMRRLGASCDWQRECFTMDDNLSAAVTQAFVKLYEDGYIYRGKRLVNWDPVLLTAVSDLEVVSEEESGVMYHVRYPFVDDEDNGIIIATTRPETILVDGAIAVHPDDERFLPLLGKRVWVPLCSPPRSIEIIADEYVDPQFGSGCVKITAAHDFNDYAVYQRHPDIPLIVLFTPDAKMNENAPETYRGMDRFAAREKIVADLTAQGLLIKQEPHRYKLPRGDRSKAVIEPMLTDQWFMRMDKMAERGLALADEGQVRFVPDNWRRVYQEWLSKIHDWCISRQLLWGHQIPAWQDPDGNWYIAETEEQAQQQAGDKPLTRETDVLDTWFSSALWPYSTLDWHTQPENPHFQSYFPTSVLITGFDILFFWVARMVMMTDYMVGGSPFHDVYITGLVRDREGQKMSKSRGNILDPLDLADGISLEELLAKRTHGLMKPEQAQQIEADTRQQFPDGIPAYGVDALRFTFASLASYGREIKFDLGRCEGYRHFCNKLWNAARFVLSVADGGYENAAADIETVANLPVQDEWIISRLQRAEQTVADSFAEYRFDLAALEIYQFFWDDYCSWYLEVAKVQLIYGDASVRANTTRTLLAVLEAGLRLCHPIMPFITEQLWQKVAPLVDKKTAATIMLAAYPQAEAAKINPTAEAAMARLKAIVEAARQLRQEYNQPGATLLVSGSDSEQLVPFLVKLAGCKNARSVAAAELPTNAPTVKIHELTLLMDCPQIDIAARNEQRQRELQQLQTELAAVEKMLANPQFMQKAREQAINSKQQQQQRLLQKIDELTSQTLS